MPATVARFSQLFIPTLKEAPADAQVVSHKLLVRAGFIRQLGAGIYDYLPLARRTLTRIEAILREEMAAIGAQEFYLPALHPAEIWRESGRWDVMGDNMFRLRDRKHAEYCLGMTHEEIFTAIARDELRSYRQLPQTWYQIQTKFRDEPRPKSGLLRVRQFTMKDAYSFDVDAAGLDRSYEAERAAYERIFRRCGLPFVVVQAHSGAMGGTGSQEFMVRTDAGEDLVAACPVCPYAANTETATSRIPAERDEPAAGLARFATPGVVTIEALAQPPYAVPARRQLKTLVYVADDRPVLAVVRGDHALNEAKLQSATGAAVLRPAHPEEIWPMSIAPYHATVLTLGKEPELARAAEDVCAALAAAGVDVLYDDRDERPGVKFKDADLIGLPIRIAVGKRGLAEGKVEWKRRGEPAVEMVAPGDVVARAAALIGAERGR